MAASDPMQAPVGPAPTGTISASSVAVQPDSLVAGLESPDSWVMSRQKGTVLHLQMNRPLQYNALSEEMLESLVIALDAADGDPSIRVVVLGGEGRAFCAGHDLRQMRAQPSRDYYQALFSKCTAMMMRIQRLSKPVIARVHGIATAAGCQLVGMCDLAVASTHARFAVSGIGLGLFCSTPSVALTRNLSRKAAFEMLVTGAFIDAVTARERGLVNTVVSPERLDAEITSLTDEISAKPADAIAIGKRLFYRQLDMGIDAAYQLAGQSMACNLMSASAVEGIDAFLEKRPPNWP